MKLIRQVQQLTSQPSVNTGKGLDEVQERQRRHKISALRESCKTALWFCDSFNLDLLKITFKVSVRTTKNLKILRRSRDDEPIKSEETSGIEPNKSKETRMPACTTNPFPTSIATFQLVDHG